MGSKFLGMAGSAGEGTGGGPLRRFQIKQTKQNKQTNKQTNKTNLRRFQPGAPYIGIEGVGYGLTPLRSSATGKSSTLGGRFLRKDGIKGKVQKNG